MVVSQQQQRSSSSSSSSAAAAKRNNNNQSSSLSGTDSGTHQHRQQQRQEEPTTPRYQQQEHQQQIYGANPIYMLETERHNTDSPYGNGGNGHQQHGPYHTGQARAVTSLSSSSGPRVIVVEDLLVGEHGNGMVGGGEQGGLKVARSAAQSISYVHAPIQHPGSGSTHAAQAVRKSGGKGHQPALMTTGYSMPNYEHIPISSYLDSAHGLGNLGGGSGDTLASLSSSSNHCPSLSSANDLGITTVYQVIGDKLTPSIANPASSSSLSNDQNGGDDHRMLIIGSSSYRQPTPSSLAASLHQHHLAGIGPSGAVINGGPNLSATTLNSSPYLSCYDTTMGGGGDYSAYYQTFTTIQWCAQPTTGLTEQSQPHLNTHNESEPAPIHLQRLYNPSHPPTSSRGSDTVRGGETNGQGTKSSRMEHYQPTQTPPVRSQPSVPGDTNGSTRNSIVHYSSLPSQQQSGLQQHQPTLRSDDNSPTLSVDGDNDGDISESGGVGGGRRTARNGRDPDGLGHTARTPPETPAVMKESRRNPLFSHCHELDLEPVNAASFGKLIRSVFKGLKTRRLGTRGNSKYHYDGIRIKLSSPLASVPPPQEYGGARVIGGLGRTVGMRNSRRLHSSLHGNRSANGNLYQPPPSAIIPMAPHDDPPAYHLRPRTNSSAVSVAGDGGDVLVRNVSESSVDYAAQAQCDGHVEMNGDGNGIVVTCREEGEIHSNGMSNSSSVLNTSGDTTTTISESMRETPPMGLSSTTTGQVASSQFEAVGSGVVPHVPSPDLSGMEADLALLDITTQMVDEFAKGYHHNCEKVLECVKRLQFDSIETVWCEFSWLRPTGRPNSGRVGAQLDGDQLGRICSLAPVQDFVHNMDIGLYQVLVDVLIPDVLRTVLSRRLSCQIRYFARNVEQWMGEALNAPRGSTTAENNSLPPKFREMKLASARLFVLALTRYTSFNHLADAARAVLRNEEQIAQMYNDFCRVDFSIVHSQADWVCGCDPQLIASIEADFRENLRLQKNLDEWTEWMEAVVDQMLACYHDRPIEVLANASKQFLLKWSFYSSMILRDVTYRSAQSFGSFHLIRLLYDEYMNILVENRLAKATNQPVICVMGGEWMRNLGSGRQVMCKGDTSGNVGDSHNGGGEETAPHEYENLIDAATDIAEIRPPANTFTRDDHQNGAMQEPENEVAPANIEPNEEDVIMTSIKEEVIS